MKENGKNQPLQDDPELAWGRNAVLGLIAEAPKRVRKVLVLKDSHHHAVKEIEDACRVLGIPFQKTDRPAIERICPGTAHQGVVAHVMPIEMGDIENLPNLLPRNPEPALVILLDHLQDPNNLGSIARSAEAFGATAIVVPRRRSALPTGAVLKSSAGAAARLPILAAPNLLLALDRLEPDGFWSVGLDHNAGEKLDGAPLPARLTLIVGSEGKGMSKPVETRCDERRRIPMLGKSGSLNASVAAAIAMYEWKRMIDKGLTAP